MSAPDFQAPGLSDDALDRKVLRKLLLADVAGYERQIAGLQSMIRVYEAQIATLDAYRVSDIKKLAAMGDDDDPE